LRDGGKEEEKENIWTVKAVDFENNNGR